MVEAAIDFAKDHAPVHTLPCLQKQEAHVLKAIEAPMHRAFAACLRHVWLAGFVAAVAEGPPVAEGGDAKQPDPF
jgi:hypothetical protein